MCACVCTCVCVCCEHASRAQGWGNTCSWRCDGPSHHVSPYMYMYVCVCVSVCITMAMYMYVCVCVFVWASTMEWR